MAAHTAAYPQN